jgi:hypothetical protein
VLDVGTRKRAKSFIYPALKDDIYHLVFSFDPLLLSFSSSFKFSSSTEVYSIAIGIMSDFHHVLSKSDQEKLVQLGEAPYAYIPTPAVCISFIALFGVACGKLGSSPRL